MKETDQTVGWKTKDRQKRKYLLSVIIEFKSQSTSCFIQTTLCNKKRSSIMQFYAWSLNLKFTANRFLVT